MVILKKPPGSSRLSGRWNPIAYFKFYMILGSMYGASMKVKYMNVPDITLINP
jgi:hypothetical protein